MTKCRECGNQYCQYVKDDGAELCCLCSGTTFEEACDVCVEEIERGK